MAGADAFHMVNEAFQTGELDRKLRWKNENAYRTTYQDLCNHAETAVRSDYPSGYGGHVPSVRHDVIFRNTNFDQSLNSRKCPERDHLPDFNTVKTGVPTFTKNPKGLEEPPKAGTIPTINALLTAPWATMKPLRDPPRFRNAAAAARPLITQWATRKAAAGETAPPPPMDSPVEEPPAAPVEEPISEEPPAPPADLGVTGDVLSSQLVGGEPAETMEAPGATAAELSGVLAQADQQNELQTQGLYTLGRETASVPHSHGVGTYPSSTFMPSGGPAEKSFFKTGTAYESAFLLNEAFSAGGDWRAAGTDKIQTRQC
uniref:Uncharacterized protein n=1 Tax=Chromera velia CCMP2878 TaxID=1169474 RepID=A0A0G4HBA1_9ALVE|eukprot:Cvel_921.t1-p1 / transcript=Cvel_921.t1 / gene=Cvel_921 / organism=Chromera_velia_CCMP2878 / gene_product=hypothetical protein / transcript_product=hypothetical protein / location=Cvel_scaffold29:76380-78028(+) / protein_length=315 / sequence_SO=supercontig / SO=protein_coding / is_pseudo=false